MASKVILNANYSERKGFWHPTWRAFGEKSSAPAILLLDAEIPLSGDGRCLGEWYGESSRRIGPPCKYPVKYPHQT